ncbi:MAG: lytic transglycosylase domain-containing protein [Eubacteriales bacterium]
MAKRRSTAHSVINWLFGAGLILLVAVTLTLLLSRIHNTVEWIDESRYFPKDEEHPEKLKYADYVEAASKEFGVEVSVIYAVIYCESNFDADAVSSVGARGLMQMMPATFAEMQGYLGETYDADALFEPQISIRYGTYYLSRMYDRFGDWEVAFAAYNAGPTAVSKWLKDENYCKDGKLVHIPYPETENYVKKVAGMVEKYKEYYQVEEQNDT